MATVHQMQRGNLGNASGNVTLLTLGSTGEAVKLLQQQLNKLRVTFIAIPEDAVYTIDTANAVKAFQQKVGITVSGSVDAETQDALVAAVGAATVAGTNGAALAPTKGAAQKAQPKFALWQLGLMVAGGLAMVGGALWLVTKKDESDEPREPREPREPELGKLPRTVDGEVISRSAHVEPVSKPTKVAHKKCDRTPDEKLLGTGEVLLPAL